MKRKILKRLVTVVLTVTAVLTLVSCAARLNGTYAQTDGLVKQTFTFMEDNKVKVSAFGVDVDGEYMIEKDEITITYNLFGLNYDMVKSFEKDGDSIFIDGEEFVKQK